MSRTKKVCSLDCKFIEKGCTAYLRGADCIYDSEEEFNVVHDISEDTIIYKGKEESQKNE